MAILLSKVRQSVLGDNQGEEWIIRDLDRILEVKVFLRLCALNIRKDAIRILATFYHRDPTFCCVENQEEENSYLLPRASCCPLSPGQVYWLLQSLFTGLSFCSVSDACTPLPRWRGFIESHTPALRSVSQPINMLKGCETGGSHHSMSNFFVFSLLHLLKVRDYIYHHQTYMEMEKRSLPAHCLQRGGVWKGFLWLLETLHECPLHVYMLHSVKGFQST